MVANHYSAKSVSNDGWRMNTIAQRSVKEIKKSSSETSIGTFRMIFKIWSLSVLIRDVIILENIKMHRLMQNLVTRKSNFVYRDVDLVFLEKTWFIIAKDSVKTTKKSAVNVKRFSSQGEIRSNITV